MHAQALEQASPFVGLASISNDETTFVFAVDSARVDVTRHDSGVARFARSMAARRRENAERDERC